MLRSLRRVCELGLITTAALGMATPGCGTSSGGAHGSGTESGTDSGFGGGGGDGSKASIAIAPNSATVVAGGKQTFTCTVMGLSNTACSWSVEEAGGGTVSSAGVYTAPANGGGYHVVATSKADAALRAVASVVVPTVGACDSLAGVGTWENITPPAFTTPANQQSIAVAVNPQQPNIVFAAAGNVTNGPGCPMGQTCPTTGTGVYVSTDCGKTFTFLSKGPADAFANGDLWAVRVDPVNLKNMYTMNGYGSPPTLFKSTDAGAHWKNLFTSAQFTTPAGMGGTFQYGGFVRSFDVEAADPSHLVVAFHEDCMGPIAAMSPDAMGGAVMCLAESRDGGSTWSFFEGPIPPTSADGGAPTILGKDTLIYTNPGSGDGTGWYMGDPARKLSSWKPIFTYAMTGPFYALNQAGGYFDADGTLYMGGANAIFSTKPGPSFGQSWTMVPGSPQSVIVGGDGRSATAGGMLFASGMNPTDHVYTGSIDGTKPWAPMKTPAAITAGIQTFAYDTVHHVLYGAGWSEGLWRVVTY